MGPDQWSTTPAAVGLAERVVDGGVNQIGSGVPELRGLENQKGSNHCFLNVAIQALWNLESFRTRFMAAGAHHHHGPNEDPEHCCFCALRLLFSEYQLSQESAFQPDVLRKALSNVYMAQGRFELGAMEDSTEALEALLDFFHACSLEEARDGEKNDIGSIAGCSTIMPSGDEHHADSGGSSSSCRKKTMPDCSTSASGRPRSSVVEDAIGRSCHPRCIAHEVFGIEYVDIARCTFCGSTQEPTTMSSYVYQAYVAELFSMSAEAREDVGRFSHMFRAFAGFADARSRKAEIQGLLRNLCQHDLDQKCRDCSSLKTTVFERWLTRLPLVFVISLVWPGNAPAKDLVWLLLGTIQPELRVGQIFRSEFGESSPSKLGGPKTGDEDTADIYRFRGLICYAGMHYITFFWSWPRCKWILFDDMVVREEGDWSRVVAFLTCGKYVPTLLFYEHQAACLVSTEALHMFVQQVRDLEDHRQTCSTM
mmetsp:Transcript_90814/g.256486  ORF Transcript_90814/g.256486 Transcript_90814/m.256486 type:complete len:480 (-) Transcript_90814:99-1538(-)